MSLSDVIESYTTGLYRVDRLPVGDVVDGHRVVPATFDQVASGVDDVADTIVLPAHGLATGFGPVWALSDTLPRPLDANVAYWVIAVDTDHVKLALTRVDALAHVAIDLLDDGVGLLSLATHFFAKISVQDDGASLEDEDEGQRTQNTATVWTLIQLYDGGAVYEADVVTLPDGRYRVEKVAHYTILDNFYKATVERIEIP